MIDRAPFGRTGHDSSRVLFGAAALAAMRQEKADQLLAVLLEHGVNPIDTAASYGDSELRLAPWLQRYRDRFFLATKTGERTHQKARDEFHRSLERLQVDSVDLLQLHYLIQPEEWEIALGPGGVLEMALEAREQGLLRYIGVTGHDVAIAGMHQRSLERFEFDSILLPFSYIMMQNPDYAAAFNAVVATCQERGVAVQTIKSLVRRPWAEDQKRTHITWYEPLTEQAAIDRAVHWVLGRDGVFLNSTGDITVLPKILDAASRFQNRPADEAMQADVERLDMAPLFV